MNYTGIHRAFVLNKAMQKARKIGILPDRWYTTEIFTMYAAEIIGKPFTVSYIETYLKKVGRQYEYAKLDEICREFTDRGYFERSDGKMVKYSLSLAGGNWLKSFEKCIRDCRRVDRIKVK